MPIVPRPTQQARMQNSAPVQIASTNDARITGETMANFGDQITKFANQQYQFEREIKRSEFNNVAENSARLAELEAKEKSAADGSDYVKNYQEALQPKLNKAINEYGGGDRRLMTEFNTHAKNINRTGTVQAMYESAGRRERFNFDRLEKLTDSAANRVRETPNQAMISAEMKSFGASLDSMVLTGGLSAENANKVRSALNEKVARSYIDGLGNKEQYGLALNHLRANQEDPNAFTTMTPAQAKDLGFIDSREMSQLQEKGEPFKVPVLTKGDKVKLSPEVATALNSLPANVRANLIDQMQAKAQQRTAVRMADLNANLQGFKTVAMTGADIDEKQIAQMKKDINMAPHLTPQARRRLMDDINSTVAINQTLKVAAATPRSQWGNLVATAGQKMQAAGEDAAKIDPRLKGLENDFAVQGNRLESLHRLQTALNQTRAQQDEDSAQFMLANDSQVQTLYNGTKDGRGFEKYATVMLNKQSQLGIPQDKRRLLTKQETSALAQTLQAVPDSYTMNDAISAMEAKYGKYFPNVMDELTKTDKRFSDYRVITQVAPSARGPLVDAVKNEATITTAVKNDKTLSEKARYASEAINSLLVPFKGAVAGASEDSSVQASVNSLARLANLQAQRDMVANPNLTAPQAAKKAYDTVVGQNFHILNGGNSSVLIPKQIGRYVVDDKNSSIFKTYMRVYSNPDNLVSDLNAYVPPNQDKNLFLSDARWVTNETQTGLMLIKPTPQGPAYLKDKFGNPIEKSYEEIFTKPGQKVVEADKSNFKKFSDWIAGN